MAGTSDPALFFDDWALTDDGVTCPYCLKFGYTKEYSRPGVRANHIKSCLNRGRYEARCPKPAFSAAAYKPTLVTPPQGDQGTIYFARRSLLLFCSLTSPGSVVGAGPAPDHSFGDNDPAPPDDDGNHSPGPGPTREQLVDRFSIRFADLVLNGNGGQGFSRCCW